jgi:hypothetical protein
MVDFIWWVIFLWIIGSILAVIWMAHRNNLRDLNESLEQSKETPMPSPYLYAQQQALNAYNQQLQNSQNQQCVGIGSVGSYQGYLGAGVGAGGVQWVATTGSPVTWQYPTGGLTGGPYTQTVTVPAQPIATGSYKVVLYFDPVTREYVTIHVDDAYSHLIENVSSQQALSLSRPTLPEGEFSLDELDKAETIISELEGHAA